METDSSIHGDHVRPRVSLNLIRAALFFSVATFVVAALPEVNPHVGVAQAQDSRKAKKAFKAGKKAYAKGEFASAAELFKQAYEYDPKPEILYNIGQSLKDAGEYQEAATFFTRYLEELPGAANAETVQETLFELQQLIAATLSTVAIDGPEEGMDVYIDGDQEPRCVTPCILALSPGPHTVAMNIDGELQTRDINPEAGEAVALQFAPAAGAVGYLTVTTNVEGGRVVVDGEDRGAAPVGPLELEPGIYPIAIVVGGETRWSRTVEIVSEQAAEVEATVAPKVVEEGGGGGGAGVMSITGFSLIGIGIGSFAAGGFFGLSASSIESDLQGQMDRGERPNEELIAQGETQALYANLFYGVGAIAVATGVVLYLLDDTGAAESAPATGITPTEGGALVHTRFEF